VSDTRDPLGIAGTVLDGKYVLERAVGEGGAAIVYRAENVAWKVPVAIKLLVSFGQLRPRDQEAALKEFVQEGRLVAELSARCPAIVQARDQGILCVPGQPNIPYLVLEWLEGKGLDEILVAETRAGVEPRGLEEAMRLLEPVAVALVLAHHRGVAHRDIKPENIFVLGDPRAGDAKIKLLDFGIAKVMASRLTGVHQTGTMPTAFTPHYGAPEQFSRSFGDTGPWSDVYAMALVLLEVMRGGERALSGDDYLDLGRQTCDLEARPTPRALHLEVSDAVEAVFARALAVQPELRYDGMLPFWTALSGAVRPSSAPWRPPSESLLAHEPSRSATPRPRGHGRSIVRVALAGAMLMLVSASAMAGFKLWRMQRGERNVAPGASASAAPPPLEPAPAGADSALARAAPSDGGPSLCPPGAVVVPGGRFDMGTSDPQASGDAREHVAYVDTFCLDRTEVTVRAYAMCVDEGRCPRPSALWDACNFGREGRAEHPMNCVTHGEGGAYCGARAMRLPTEAEWELAAASREGELPWGSDAAAGRAKLGDGSGTAPVATHQTGASREGVQDLIGNVAEWVGDWYAPYGQDQVVNPRGPQAGTLRVVRGGSFAGVRSVGGGPAVPIARAGTHRDSLPPDDRSPAVGFRCAATLR
jgi:formylglycine-generating enzyme required for sulfatase activity